MRACAVLGVAYVFEFFHKIFANEALCSGHEYIHKAYLRVFPFYFTKIFICTEKRTDFHMKTGSCFAFRNIA